MTPEIMSDNFHPQYSLRSPLRGAMVLRGERGNGEIFRPRAVRRQIWILSPSPTIAKG